jgi:hypothetical protein
MTWEQAFTAANAVALLSWLALIFLPRWPQLISGLRFGVIGLIAAAYTIIVAMHFFGIEGAGYMTLAGVKRLFSSDPVIVAGWLHVIALDLFAGLWIAERLDSQGRSRAFQAPILTATFLFGPFGLLAAYLAGLVPASEPARL